MVFITSLFIVIYNFEVLISVVPIWQSGKHYFVKFIFVTLVLLILFSWAVTWIIDWIIKTVSQRKS